MVIECQGKLECLRDRALDLGVSIHDGLCIGRCCLRGLDSIEYMYLGPSVLAIPVVDLNIRCGSFVSSSVIVHYIQVSLLVLVL